MNYLEKRAAENGGDLSEPAMLALRSGWYLGDVTFRDQLLALVEKGSKVLSRKGSHAAAPVKGHGEREAEKMVLLGLEKLGLSAAGGEIIRTRKVALASVIKAHTSVGNERLAERLEMGHNRSLSRLIRQGRGNPEIQKLCTKVLKMLPCELRTVEGMTRIASVRPWPGTHRVFNVEVETERSYFAGFVELAAFDFASSGADASPLASARGIKDVFLIFESRQSPALHRVASCPRLHGGDPSANLRHERRDD